MDKIQISDSKRGSIVARLTLDIEAANNYYEQEIEPDIIERYDMYKADKKYYRKMFPVLSKRCEMVSTDIQDTIESVMPAIMETFFGSADVITVQGQDGGPEDEARAEKMQALINYELERERFYMVFYQWTKDALITNMGVVKVDWERTYNDEHERVPVSPDALQQFQADAANGVIQLHGVEQDPSTGMIIAEISTLKKNKPRIKNVLASEFRFSPDATNLQDADFVAHRKIVSIDYLRKQEKAGLYSHVEELLERAQTPHYTQLDQVNNEHIDEEANQIDSGRRKVELYECYVNINMTEDEDGELTPMIITISNGVILRMEENTYERHPFFTLCPRIDPHKIWPENGFIDQIEQIQHIKTATYRQIIYNMAQANDSKIAINTAMMVDINDVLEGRQIYRCNGDIKEAIMPIPVAELAPWTFSMLEYLDNIKENRTGVTRYNQGMDSGSLNKTATGINIITQQANKRLEIIARTFAETGLRELFKFLIKMNQLFINQEMVVRLTNGPMQIYPDDLEGDFDLIVNAGMGAGAQQQRVANLQAMGQLMMQLYQAGMVGPEEIYNYAKKYIEELGYKNADDFIRTPQEAMQAAQEQAQMQAAGQAQPISERLNIDYNTIPWQIQMQMFQKEGYNATPDMWTEKTTQDALQTAVDEHSKADAQRESVGERIANRQARTAQAASRFGQGSGGMQGQPNADSGFNPQ